MEKLLMCFVCFLLLQVKIMAQDVQVQPTPRQMTVKEEGVITPVSFRLEGELEANPQAIRLLKAFLGDCLSSKGLPLYVGEKGARAVQARKCQIPNQLEGYYLEITKKGITLAGNDERGTYYAVRTFMQLFRDNQLPQVEIRDYPDVRFRGATRPGCDSCSFTGKIN